MRAVSVVAAAVLLGLVGAPAVSAAPRHRTESQDYFLGDAVPDCWLFTGVGSPPGSPVPSNKGGACFRVRPFEVIVAVKVDDDSGLPVAGTYQFETARGTSGAYRRFCESFAARVPAGAARLVVFIHGPLNGALLYGPSTDIPACLDRGWTGWGTTGEIEARFTRDPRYF